ncbi:MAG: hypothetical protein R3185_07475, partial [Candidatus Thermoplasmatota archaeon]|nr:hypothetical protein [Candidatus Thermoplasmatota archaeon]
AILAAFALLGLYFLIRSRLEARSGALLQPATYCFQPGDPPRLRQLDQASSPPSDITPLGAKRLQAILRLAETRNDLTIEAVDLAGEQEVPYQHVQGRLDQLIRVHLRDSKTDITIHRDGTITTHPALDTAVARDLADILAHLPRD